MVATPSLGLDITSIGVITSIFPLCYGCSKFVSGVVGDILSPSVMLGGGLIATGFVRPIQNQRAEPLIILLLLFFQINIAFGASSTLPLFCMLWAVNGINPAPLPLLLSPEQDVSDTSMSMMLLPFSQAYFKALVPQVVRRYSPPGLPPKNGEPTGCV